MDGEKLKIQIGLNIASLRKRCGMTQAELAQRLNYSDKAVSKWERGDSVPDVLTLLQLGELFGVSLEKLVSEDVCDDNTEVSVKKPERPPVSRTAIVTMSSLLVWFLALTVYVILASVGISTSWVCFIYAIPVNAIVMLVLRSAFRRFTWNHMLVSTILWGCLGTIYVSLLVFADVNVWRIFLLGVLGQLAVTLWFAKFSLAARMRKNRDA